MVRPGREQLKGPVEVDETYLGAVEEGVRGRQTERKALLVIAAEENGKGIGRIRMGRVRDASAASLIPFVERHRSRRAAWCIPTAGWDTNRWKRKGTSIVSATSKGNPNEPRNCCRESTKPRLY